MIRQSPFARAVCTPDGARQFNQARGGVVKSRVYSGDSFTIAHDAEGWQVDFGSHALGHRAGQWLHSPQATSGEGATADACTPDDPFGQFVSMVGEGLCERVYMSTSDTVGDIGQLTDILTAWAPHVPNVHSEEPALTVRPQGGLAPSPHGAKDVQTRLCHMVFGAWLAVGGDVAAAICDRYLDGASWQARCGALPGDVGAQGIFARDLSRYAMLLAAMPARRPQAHALYSWVKAFQEARGLSASCDQLRAARVLGYYREQRGICGASFSPIEYHRFLIEDPADAAAYLDECATELDFDSEHFGALVHLQPQLHEKIIARAQPTNLQELAELRSLKYVIADLPLPLQLELARCITRAATSIFASSSALKSTFISHEYMFASIFVRETLLPMLVMAGDVDIDLAFALALPSPHDFRRVANPVAAALYAGDCVAGVRLIRDRAQHFIDTGADDGRANEKLRNLLAELSHIEQGGDGRVDPDAPVIEWVQNILTIAKRRALTEEEQTILSDREKEILLQGKDVSTLANIYHHLGMSDRLNGLLALGVTVGLTSFKNTPALRAIFKAVYTFGTVEQQRALLNQLIHSDWKHADIFAAAVERRVAKQIIDAQDRVSA